MSVYDETSMAAVFWNQVEKYGDKACVAYKKEGRYVDISWNQMGEMVKNLASFLISRGINKGDNVAIFSPNRYEWWVTDLAIMSIGAVDVPVYATNSAEEALYVLDHSRAKACFVGEQEHLEKVLQVNGQLPNLELIVIYDTVKQDDENIFTFMEVLEIGRDQGDKDEFKNRLRSIKPSDLATIMYTSGTTGPPKGVMLSQNNFISNVNQVLADRFLFEEDLFLSFLPLSHALERTAGFYVPMSIGAKVAFAENFAKIQENMVEVRPTIIISVPRLYEKIHVGILSRITKAPASKRVLFGWAVRIASKNLPYVCHNKARKGWFAIKYRLADKLVFSKIRTALGMDRINFAVSGGGPLSITDAEFFLGMGIIVLEGFGLTETSPATNVNRPWLIKPGTVGPPLRDTTITISDEGEILIKGPQVMLGYYKDKEATRRVFTEDGFLKTEDIGSMDEDGYLSITGRIKDIIITSGGKNISPQGIENRLKDSRFIEQVCVIGDRRKYLSALIVPDFGELEQWAEEKGIVFDNHEDMIQDKQVIGFYEEEIEKCLQQFSQVEKIKKFRLLSASWSQQAGELTPTLKVKRRVVEGKYADIVEAMYPPEIP
jgi:long-chain acyl-CoA synthetase